MQSGLDSEIGCWDSTRKVGAVEERQRVTTGYRWSWTAGKAGAGGDRRQDTEHDGFPVANGTTLYHFAFDCYVAGMPNTCFSTQDRPEMQQMIVLECAGSETRMITSIDQDL